MPDLDLNSPETQAALKEAGYFSKEQVEQYANDRNSALDATKNDILNQLKDTKAKLSSLPVDPDTLSKLAEDPRFSKIKEVGFDAYEKTIDATSSERLSAMKSDYMMLEQEKLRIEQDLQKENENLKVANKHTMIENKLQGLIFSHKDDIIPTAIPDLIREAKEQLDFDDKGAMVVKGENGTYRQNADGPMTEKDWLKDLMKTKPHLFSGAAGGQHGQSRFGNVDTSKMSAAEKISAGRRDSRR